MRKIIARFSRAAALTLLASCGPGSVAQFETAPLAPEVGGDADREEHDGARGGEDAASGAVDSCGFPAQPSDPNWSSRDFFARVAQPGTPRELAIVAQALNGNVPNVLRSFASVALSGPLRGKPAVVEVDVSFDYLEIGDDVDFVRVPLTPFAAQYLASRLGMALPTKKLVDAIYDAASVKLSPQPTDWYKYPGAMRHGPNYVVHSSTIESQRNGRVGLIAGHKKDVVATNLLDGSSGRVAIYGWQQPGNRPIQPLSTVHEQIYEDYSHGIRFVGPRVRVRPSDGSAPYSMSIGQALRDPAVGDLLNGGQGPLRDVRAARSCPPEFARAVGLEAAACPPQPRECAP